MSPRARRLAPRARPRLRDMKIASADAGAVAAWSAAALRLGAAAEVEVHVLAQGFELRCPPLQPLRLSAVPSPTPSPTTRST